MRTSTRLPISLIPGTLPNFVAIPEEFGHALRSVQPHGAVALRVQWTGPSDSSTELGPREAFVGWNGAHAQFGAFLQFPLTLATDICLERAHSMARERGAQTLQVNVFLMRDASVADTVTIEPLSFEDWEVISSRPGFVESKMLSQICVLSKDQIFTLWVDGQPIRFRVTTTMLTTSPCIRLANDTQVVVTPKPRLTSSHQQHPKNTIPATIASKNLGRPASLRLQPPPQTPQKQGSVAYIAPATLYALSKSSAWKVQDQPTSVVVRLSLPPPSTQDTFALLIPSSLAAPGHVCFSASQLEGADAFCSIIVEPLTSNPLVEPVLKIQLVPMTTTTTLGDVPPISYPLLIRNDAILPGGTHRMSITTPNVCFVATEPHARVIFATATTTTTTAATSTQQQPETLLPTLSTSSRLIVDETKSRLAPCLNRSMVETRIFSLGAPCPGAVYLHGRRGFGKTLACSTIARELAQDINCLTKTIVIDCQALKGQKRSTVQKLLEDKFTEAKTCSPSLLVFDDLDVILPDESTDAQTIWLSEMLLSLMETQRRERDAFEARVAEIVDLAADQQPLLITRGAVAYLATGKGKRSLKKSLQRPFAFDTLLELPPLDVTGRKEVLQALVQTLHVGGCEADLEPVARKCEGYSPMDLEILVRRASHHTWHAAIQDHVPLSTDDFEWAMKDFTPASLVGAKLSKSTVAWDDVGGLYKIKNVLKETLELPFLYAELFEKSPVKLASGILLYGPPGCGKTLLAAAVAGACGLNFISVKGPEVLNKYIGASEQGIRDLFARAAAAAPAVIFFDEFDATAPRRGSDSTGVTDRIVNQLLTFLDGVEGRAKGVYVMAATSRPDLIDPALLRPGRLDKQLYCGFPDEEERADILRVLARTFHMMLDDDAIKRVAVEQPWYTGADLKGLMVTMQLHMSKKPHDNGSLHEITMDDVLIAMNDTRPSVNGEEHARYERLYGKFRGERDADFKEKENASHQRVSLR